MVTKRTARKLDRADRKVSKAVGAKSGHPVVAAIGTLSEVGDQPPLRALSVLTIAGGLIAGDRAATRAGVRMLAAHTLATAMKTAIKRTVDRTRPDHAERAGYRIERGGSDRHELSSFPSGHTAGAVAVAEALARDKPAAAAAGRTGAALVSIAQVPRAKHFVGDVIVGAAIGFVAERAASALLDRLWPEPAAPNAPVVAMPPGAALRRSPSGN